MEISTRPYSLALNPEVIKAWQQMQIMERASELIALDYSLPFPSSKQTMAYLAKELRVYAEPVGSMSALWDEILDLEAAVKGEETLLKMSDAERIREATEVLRVCHQHEASKWLEPEPSADAPTANVKPSESTQ